MLRSFFMWDQDNPTCFLMKAMHTSEDVKQLLNKTRQYKMVDELKFGRIMRPH
ncbi:hypothetical protein V5J35_003138 [Endozoicomonas sp. NE40]|uniref:Uncharacterized protein n=1 Tax=Endozoicomonas lisbonensis TaxID=3120522 RepID=A0ABV2SJK8_9GAMM